MIIKYKEYIRESLSTKKSIKDWLDSMKINNYTINDDLTVDVDDDVYINNKDLIKIPVKFNKINGYFEITNNQLTSLKGSPYYVEYGFYCHDNQLTSLEGCPTTINGNFDCSNNKLSTLKGCPSTIKGQFYCYNNQLTSLEFCPTIINDDFICFNNPLEDINDLDIEILLKTDLNNIYVKQEVYDKYFEHWITKDSRVFNKLKDVISKDKFKEYFHAKDFDLL